MHVDSACDVRCVVASVWLAMVHHVCQAVFIMPHTFPDHAFVNVGSLTVSTSRLNDLRVHAFSLHFNYTI